MAPEAASSILKPRFKGVENILRKIAFNLGNSPSQTSVKIISCIPIDVTDLQNKIVDLERELDQRPCAQNSPQDDRRQPQARVAIGAPVYTPAPPFFEPKTNAPALSPSPSLNAEPPSRISLSEVDSGPVRISSPVALTHEDMLAATPPTPEDFKCTPKKQKKTAKAKTMEKKRKGTTQMVYFAQTVYPKKMGEEGSRRSKLRGINEDELGHTYLEDVLQRQYQPEVMTAVDPSSECSSAFSWPVCRDEPASGATHAHCDSDVCSCCHGLFHNVDTTPDTNAYLQRDYSVYYDSSFYDVVPVKESPRYMMNSDVYQKRQNDVFFKFENKTGTQFQQPFVTRYCTLVSPNRYYPKTRCKKKLTNKSAVKREQVIRAMQKRKQEHKLATDFSVSDCVDCGEVYTKPYNPRPRVIVSQQRTLKQPPPAPTPVPLPRSPILKNAECLTTGEEHTSTSRSVQFDPPPPPQQDNKTEITLNQIKSILHAVLTEVKTNAQLKTQNAVLEDKSTKDAIVQNGLSHNNIAANSSYMNNYLYNPPYNFDNMYDPLFPSQVAEGQSFYQPGPGGVPPRLYRAEVKPSTRAGLFSTPGTSPCADAAKCVQNYPLFIHTPGRQCTCCYRSVPAHLSNFNQTNTSPAHITPKPVPNTTNTEANKNQDRTKETNNLIKEIYKSLALNTSYPRKDTSSNFTERSSINASNKRIDLKIRPKGGLKTVTSEILHKNEKRPLFMNEIEQLASMATSYRSEVKTTTTAASGLDSVGASPRGDGVCSLMCAKKELVSTGSETPVSQCYDYSPAEERGRKYSSTERDQEHSARDKRDHGYDRRDQSYDRRSRRYSPADERELNYSPTKDRRKYTVPALTTTTASDEDTVTPSIEDSEPSESTVVEIEKKEKKGLFSKMKKLFTTRRRRKRDEDTSDIEQEASDSDDYETVYSERTGHTGKGRRRSPTPPPVTRRRRPHSKVSFSRYNRREPHSPRSPRLRQEATVVAPRHRRSPYMEQEYRRHWTEDLTFHQGNTPKLSSQRPYTRSGREFDFARYMSPPGRPSPYWQEYEARQAFVPPPPLQAPRPQYPPPHYPPPHYPPPHYPPPQYPPAQYPPPQYPPPQQNVPPLRPPYAPRGCPYPPTQDQVNKGGQMESGVKPMYFPQTFKPAATGLNWFKKLNKPCFQCGVPWKRFFLDG